MVSVLTVSGMISVHSRRAVFTALAGVAGVSEADVERGRVVVVHDDAVTDEAIAAAIDAVGCTVTSIERVSRRRLPVHRGTVEPEADGTA
jgi:copper chaperone CopZ